MGDQWQTNDPIHLDKNSDKYWRVELNETAKNKINPVLVFGWQPIQLQIITNNKPPYTLAIGGQQNSYSRDQVFNELLGKANPTWISGSLVSLNVKPEVITAAKKTTDWKQLLFWAALLLAVVVLLIFSLKLFKQMKLPSE